MRRRRPKSGLKGLKDQTWGKTIELRRRWRRRRRRENNRNVAVVVVVVEGKQ